MADTIEERVAKIERFIWGIGGNADDYFKVNLAKEDFDKYSVDMEKA